MAKDIKSVPSEWVTLKNNFAATSEIGEAIRYVTDTYSLFNDAVSAVSGINGNGYGSVGSLSYALTYNDICRLNEGRDKIETFCRYIHEELSESVDLPFSWKMSQFATDVYGLNPKNFTVVDKYFLGTQDNISFIELLSPVVFDDKLKADFEKKCKAIVEPPSQKLKEALYPYLMDMLSFKLEGLSDEELAHLDLSRYTDEELSVYMQEVMNRLDAGDEELLLLMEAVGKTNDSMNAVVCGLYLSMMVTNRVSFAKSQLYSRKISEYISESFSYTNREKLFEFPLLILPGATLTYSMYFETKSTNPDAVARLQTTILEDTGRIRLNIDDNFFLKPEWNKSGVSGLCFGVVTGDGGTAEVDVTKLMSGTLRIVLTYPCTEVGGYKITQKLICEIKDRDLELPRYVNAEDLLDYVNEINPQWTARGWHEIPQQGISVPKVIVGVGAGIGAVGLGVLAYYFVPSLMDTVYELSDYSALLISSGLGFA